MKLEVEDNHKHRPHSALPSLDSWGPRLGRYPANNYIEKDTFSTLYLYSMKTKYIFTLEYKKAYLELSTHEINVICDSLPN